MNWTVSYKRSILKDIRKLDKSAQQKIRQFIETELVDTDNPRKNGKALKGKYNNLWRYRLGNYRIITQLDDVAITILVLRIAHRRHVYR